MSFIDLSSLISLSSPQALAQLALQFLEAQIPGYTPSAGDLEVIQAQAVSLIAADVSATALVVPSAIWRAFGTKLIGVPYLNGDSATTQVTFTLADSLGHTVPAGTPVTLGGLGFFTAADLVVPNGMSAGTATVFAVQSGTLFNGAYTPAALVSSIDFVTGVAVLAPASGGIDQESDSDYQNRLVTELQLQAPRPITANDYAAMALSFPPAIGTDQQEVGRAVAIDGYNPNVGTFTGDLALSSTTISAVSSFANITVGTALSGTYIPAATTVVSVNTGAMTLVMSNEATNAATGETITATGLYDQARNVAVFVTDASGDALSSDTMTAVAAWLETFREVNFIVNVLSPTYTLVYVDVSVHLYPGVDPTATGLAVQAAIMNFLSPQVSGTAPFGNSPSPLWFASQTVRYDKLMGIVQQVRGVDYVPVGTLTLGTSASPVGIVDLTLSGPVALPTSTTISVPTPTIV